MDVTTESSMGAIAPEVRARRTATMLVAARVQRGFSLRTMVRRSGGVFTRDRLREIESGAVDLDRATTESLAALYGCDLEVLFSPRRPVAVDAGVVSAAGRSEAVEGEGLHARER